MDRESAWLMGIPSEIILSTLDAAARTDHGVWFPDFDHGYHYHVDAQLTVYADASRWAVVIEQLAVNPRSWQCAGTSTNLYFHGNCISLGTDPIWADRPVRGIDVLADGPGGPLTSSHELINLDAVDVTIREEVIPIRCDPEYYRSRQIVVERLTDADIDALIIGAKQHLNPKDAAAKVRSYENLRREVGQFRLCPWHLLRGMVPQHRQLLLATETERRLGVPKDLPRILQLGDWQHPRLLEGEVPSVSRSFQMIAEVIANKDPKLYFSHSGNVHWSNWPMSGSL